MPLIAKPSLTTARTLLVLAVILSCGCVSVRRTVDSPFVPPPYDASEPITAAEIERLNSAEYQLLPKSRYTIGPGDVLSLNFVGRPDILGVEESDSEGFVVRITQDPTITLPYVGAVIVHGKTAEQLQAELRSAFSAFVKDPEPVVRIREFFHNQVIVIGSVQNPGRYELQAGDTIVDAVFRAGGLTLGGRTGFAPAPVLKVYRDKLPQSERLQLDPADLLERLREGNRIIPRDEIVLPLDEFLLGGDLSFNIPLQPNDIVYIPPAGTVSILGDVGRPRVVFLGPSLRTLAHVLTEVGGLDFQAANEVEVVRTLADGTQESYFLDARRVLRRKDRDFVLRDNDQVFVYRSNWRTFLGILGQVFGASARTGVNATYNPVGP